MPLYPYKVKDRALGTIEGTVLASNRDDAVAKLCARGYGVGDILSLGGTTEGLTAPPGGKVRCGAADLSLTQAKASSQQAESLTGMLSQMLAQKEPSPSALPSPPWQSGDPETRRPAPAPAPEPPRSAKTAPPPTLPWWSPRAASGKALLLVCALCCLVPLGGFFILRKKAARPHAPTGRLELHVSGSTSPEGYALGAPATLSLQFTGLPLKLKKRIAIGKDFDVRLTLFSKRAPTYVRATVTGPGLKETATQNYPISGGNPLECRIPRITLAR